MRVLVTGANGFVGRYVCDALQTAGHAVTAVGGPSESKGWHVDLTDASAVMQLVKTISPDLVLHLAAQSSVARAWRAPQTTMEINTLGSLAVWEAAVHSGVAHMVYVSTAEVYQPVGPPALLDENSALGPINPYGVSKLATETLLSQIQVTTSTALTVIRPFNHVGPGQQKGFVFQDVATQIADIHRGTSNAIHVGNLSPIRDFLDIRDVARAYVMLVEHSELTGVYNLCSGVPRSIKTVVAEMLRLSQLDPSVLIIDPDKLRPADTPYLVGNPTLFEDQIGWQPMIPWDQTLSDILANTLNSSLHASSK